jgi:translocation and assembly module TamB
MRIRRKTWALLGIGTVAVVAAAVLVVRAWVVQAVIVRQIEARYGGKVHVRSWWLGRHSSGITGLELHEGPAADSPVWATAERVETDLSLGDLLHGRTSPGRVVIDRPSITLRLGRDNKFLTDIPIRAGGKSGGSRPPVEARDATLTFRQEGRPEFTIHNINASLSPEAGGVSAATAKADDPAWGPVTASGRFAPGFATGRLDLDAASIPSSPEKAASVPYAPPTVWEHVEPTGPLAVRLNLGFGDEGGLSYRVEVASRGATLDLPKLGIAARETAGSMVYDRKVATLEHVRGAALGGRLDVDGTLDFNPDPSRFALALRLAKIDVARTPQSWRLGNAGITGRLTGRADLRMALRPEGVDLTGTTGHATVEGATVEGIPARAVRLDLEGTGGDLKYQSEEDAETPKPAGALRDGEIPRADPVLRLASFHVVQESKVERGGVLLPKAITTRIELDDVDLRDVVKRAEKSGVKVPVEVRGLATLKAVVTVPLGALKSLRDYRLKGTVTIDDLSIGGVRPGPLRARVGLDRGVLALNDLTGRLAEVNDGTMANGRMTEARPPDFRSSPEAAPLPPGGFRIDLRAELDPQGKLSAKVEGRALPLARLAEAASGKVEGVSGAVDAQGVAEGDLEHAGDSKAWAVRGKLRGDRLAIERLTLDRVAADVRLADGKLTLDPLAADLDRQPLRASVAAELSKPYAFEAKLDVEDWDVARLASAVPALARGPELAGRLRAKGTAEGTLEPREIRTNGAGLLQGAQAGDVDVGDVPFAWRTEGETIRLRVDRARVFGGTLAGEATVPAGGGTIEGRASVAGIDLGQVARLATGGFPMAGRAGGTVRFRIPEHPEDEGADGVLVADLTAPDLTVRGTSASELSARARLRRGVVSCELTARGLGGTLSASGTAPVSALHGGEAGAMAGTLRARNIRLEGLWPALGLAGPLGPLRGLANLAIDVRPSVRKTGASPSRSVPVVTGGFGLGALMWGRNWPLGRLQGRFSYGPEGWRVDLVNASLFEGDATGSIRGTTDADGVSRATFRADIERARMHQVLAVAPLLGGGFEGFGSIHMTGQLNGSVHADAALDIGAARVFRIPLARLEVPATLDYAPDAGSGTLRIPRWSARVAGGRAWGTGLLRLGAETGHAGTIEFAGLDLETLARAAAFEGGRASGKLNGKISWTGKDPARLRQLRGLVDLDLDDAELFELPVLRQLGQFLGASRGGVFNDGDLHGVLDDDRLVVEDCTLAGRLVQLHATGTVGFDGRLNLTVVVNTPQIITETGQALLNLIPGLRRQSRRPELLARFGSYLSNRLLKFRVGGTISHPSINSDPTVLITEGAVNFFADVLKLPFNLLR